jgi:hypothetical protein
MIRSPLGRLGMAGVAGLLAVGALAAPAAAAITKGTIQGTFTTSSGAPVRAGVYIASTDYSTQINLDTDGTGAYHAQVPPGDYHVSFTWDSATQWAYQAADEDSADTITVAAGQTVEVDDRKLPTGTVGGHLTAADGSPLASASVTLHHGYYQVGWASTDDDGDYAFGETLARDGYTVSFSTGGGAEQWVVGAIAQSTARTFTVTADAQTTVDDTQLATGSLQGRLVDTDGIPESGYQVNVTFNDQNTSISYTATTDSNGEWSVAEVFPGDYRVSFVTPDDQRTQWAYGAGSEADAKLITVTTGAPVVVDDTWLPPAQLVINPVDATTGAPVTNFCVWVDTANTASDCATGSQATLGNLPGGAFHLQVAPDSSGYYLTTKQIPVTLTPGETTTVTVPLTLGGKVAFSAADHTTGAPVEGTCGLLKVIGQGGLGDGYGDCTDATGTVVTDNAMAAGTYELFAIAPGSYGHQWVGKHGGTGDQEAAARIVVQPGKTVTAPAALLDPAGTVTGVVTGSDSKPVANGYVAFSAWGDAGPSWDTGTDQNGKYTLGKLGPYAWPLLFGGGIDPRQWSGNAADRFQATGVPVAAGGTTTYDTSLIKGSTLKGTVTIPSAPAADWRINIHNAATGDQMGVLDSSGAGPVSAYALQLTGGTPVKIGWSYSPGEPSPGVTGWYNGATGLDTATKVGIPAYGSKTLNLTLS